MLLDVPVNALLGKGVWALPAHLTCMIGSAGILFPFAIMIIPMYWCLVAAGYDNPLSKIVSETLSLYCKGYANVLGFACPLVWLGMIIRH